MCGIRSLNVRGLQSARSYATRVTRGVFLEGLALASIQAVSGVMNIGVISPTARIQNKLQR